MKANKLHGVIRKRLVENRKECLKCLYPEDGYQWGCEGKGGIKKTLQLINKLLHNVPEVAWPVDKESEYKVASGNWTIRLAWADERKSCRTADLIYRNDDHTAWVVEHSKKPGVFVNYDIGGS